jgi:hypothetical protein
MLVGLSALALLPVAVNLWRQRVRATA